MSCWGSHEVEYFFGACVVSSNLGCIFNRKGFRMDNKEPMSVQNMQYVDEHEYIYIYI